MRVSIDQSLCRGDCICEQICPAVFVLNGGGLAHVIASETVLDGPQGWASVPAGREAAVLDAAAECPTQAISVRDEEGTS